MTYGKWNCLEGYIYKEKCCSPNVWDNVITLFIKSIILFLFHGSLVLDIFVLLSNSTPPSVLMRKTDSK